MKEPDPDFAFDSRVGIKKPRSEFDHYGSKHWYIDRNWKSLDVRGFNETEDIAEILMPDGQDETYVYVKALDQWAPINEVLEEVENEMSWRIVEVNKGRMTPL